MLRTNPDKDLATIPVSPASMGDKYTARTTTEIINKTHF